MATIPETTRVHKEYATNPYQTSNAWGLAGARITPVHGHVVLLNNLKIEIGLLPAKQRLRDPPGDPASQHIMLKAAS